VLTTNQKTDLKQKTTDIPAYILNDQSNWIQRFIY